MTRKLFILIWISYWTLSAPTEVWGANIIYQRIDRVLSYSLQPEALHIFRISGDIDNDDYIQFSQLHERVSGDDRLQDFIVELHSNGGSYIGGLRLAAEIRRRGVATIVRANDVCLSACALAFLGGSAELDSEYDGTFQRLEARRFMELGATIGFHAPFIEIGTQESLDGPEYISQVFRGGVDGVVELISLSQFLHLDLWHIVQILTPGSDSFYFLDTVDALRAFRTQLIVAEGYVPFDGYVASMAVNACVNNWYWGTGRGAIDGQRHAQQAFENYSQFYEILNNEGWEPVNQATEFSNRSTARIAGLQFFYPVEEVQGQGFSPYIWCHFSFSGRDPQLRYFESGNPPENAYDLQDIGEISLQTDSYRTLDTAGRLNFQGIGLPLRSYILDAFPAHTRLIDLPEALSFYYRNEPRLQ